MGRLSLVDQKSTERELLGLCQTLIQHFNRLAVLLERVHGLGQFQFELADDAHLRLNFLLSNSEVILSFLFLLFNRFCILSCLLNFFLQLLNFLLFILLFTFQLLFIFLFLFELFLFLIEVALESLLILAQLLDLGFKLLNQLSKL